MPLLRKVLHRLGDHALLRHITRIGWLKRSTWKEKQTLKETIGEQKNYNTAKNIIVCAQPALFMRKERKKKQGSICALLPR